MQQLVNMVNTLTEQSKVKKDFIVKSAAMHFVDGKLILAKEGQEVEFTPTSIFHSQIADTLDIPKKYYDRLRTSNIHLLDDNVNYWLQKDTRSQLIRTFDGADKQARAWLSDSYNIIDNYEVLFTVLDAIKSTGKRVNIEAADLTEQSMYLKITSPETEIMADNLIEGYKHAQKGVGTGIISGFVLRNSEVGKAAFTISPRAKILICGNGMVMDKDNLKLIHLGAKMDDDFFKKNAAVKRKNMELIREQVKHAVLHFLSKDYLGKMIDIYSKLGTPQVVAPIQNVLEVINKEYAFGNERTDAILKHFIMAGDTRRIGVANAITEQLQLIDNADVRHDSEVIAFDVLKNFEQIERASNKIKVKFSGN